MDAHGPACGLEPLTANPLLSRLAWSAVWSSSISMERVAPYFALSASTPGSALPSIHSRKAPPAAET